MIQTYKDAEMFFKNRMQFGIQPGLERMELLLKALGNPEQRVKGIHIAGTNGKGSTAAYLEKSLEVLDYQVGMFVSPSFEGLTGHILINNKPIPEIDFINLTQKVKPIVEELDTQNKHPSEFEIITAIAFLYFVQNTDYVIVEAGMGGREDTTNCFTPMASVITNVGLDHTTFLGSSIEEIALHKAGIIKQNRPIILGDSDPEVKKVIVKEARKLQAPVSLYSNEFVIKNINILNNTFVYESDNRNIDIQLSMDGVHQMINAATALRTLEILESVITIDWDRVRTTFKEVMLPGRFERVFSDQLFYLDGAHNEEGIKALIATLEPYKLKKDIEILFSGLKDKELDKLINQLKPKFSNLIYTTFSHPRALTNEEALEFAEKHSIGYTQSWEEWINQRVDISTKNNKMYVITGSLHFMMQVRRSLLDRNK